MERKEDTQSEPNTSTRVYFWGNDKNGLLGPDKKSRTIYPKPQFSNFGVNIDSLACGDEHVIFVSNGYLYTMGDNSDGRLGISKNVKASSSPCLVETLISVRYYIVKVACGAKFSAAISDLGKVFTWGSGENGQLGLGGTENQAIPQPVKLGNNDLKVRNDNPEIAVDLSCGVHHTGVVTKSGDIYMFGSNEFGQLGLGTTGDAYLPMRVDIPQQKIQKIACGEYHTLVLSAQGHVYSFGLNDSGQLGIGSQENSAVPQRVLTAEENRITKISAGYHSAAISVRGELYIWGESSLGNFITPRKISWTNGLEVIKVNMGDNFTIALDHKGYLWGFGNNTSGELGQGDFENWSSVKQISSLGPARVKEFSCGRDFVVALTDFSCESQERRRTKGSTSKSKDSKRSNSKLTERKQSKKAPYRFDDDGSIMREELKMTESDMGDSNLKLFQFPLKMNPQLSHRERRMKNNYLTSLQGELKDSETNLETETDGIQQESQEFSTQNQISDSVEEGSDPKNMKKDPIRNMIIDVKILKLQNTLLEQQLEERSQQIASLKRKLKEMSSAYRKNQEKEQVMNELVVKLENQGLKFHEEYLKMSDELIKRDAEIEKLRLVIEKKDIYVDSLVKDNNVLKELVHCFLQERNCEKEVDEGLETKIQSLLKYDSLHFGSRKSPLLNTQITETHKTELFHDSFKSHQFSLDYNLTPDSNSRNSLHILQRPNQKADYTQTSEKYSSGFPSRRMSPSREQPSTKNNQATKVRGLSTGIGLSHQGETSTATATVVGTEEPSTRISQGDNKAKVAKTHTKSQYSVNLTSLGSPKMYTAPSEPWQRLLTAKNTPSEGRASFHKKKLSEPVINFKPLSKCGEDKSHKTLVSNHLKTMQGEKQNGQGKEVRSLKNYFENHIFTSLNDVPKKNIVTTSISAFNTGDRNKDKIRPESSQLYQKLVGMLQPPAKNAGQYKAEKGNSSVPTKQNLFQK